MWRNPKLSATSTTPFSEFISIPYSIFQLLRPYIPEICISRTVQRRKIKEKRRWCDLPSIRIEIQQSRWNSSFQVSITNCSIRGCRVNHVIICGTKPAITTKSREVWFNKRHEFLFPDRHLNAEVKSQQIRWDWEGDLWTYRILLTCTECMFPYTLFSYTLAKSQTPICPFFQSVNHTTNRNEKKKQWENRCRNFVTYDLLISSKTLSPDRRMLFLVGWNSKHVTRLLWYRITAQWTWSGITYRGLICIAKKKRKRISYTPVNKSPQASKYKETYGWNSWLELTLKHKVDRVLCIPMGSWEYSVVSNYSMGTWHCGVAFNWCSKKRKHSSKLNIMFMHHYLSSHLSNYR